MIKQKERDTKYSMRKPLGHRVYRKWSNCALVIHPLEPSGLTSGCQNLGGDVSSGNETNLIEERRRGEENGEKRGEKLDAGRGYAAFVGRLRVPWETLVFAGRGKEIYRVRENAESVAAEQGASGRTKGGKSKGSKDFSEAWNSSIDERGYLFFATGPFLGLLFAASLPVKTN